MPKSAIAVTSILIDVATFDVPYINVVDIFGASNLRNSTEVFKPDILADDNNNEKQLTKHLDQLGYSSHYISVCMGSVYVAMVGSVLALLLILLLYPLKNVRAVTYVR